LESIGDTNRTHLEASFHPLPLYAITPAQIVTAMMTLYGVATGTDLQRLRKPLLEPLKALSELEPFMARFKFNTLKLTASGILRPSSLRYRASRLWLPVCLLSTLSTPGSPTTPSPTCSSF
jgi:hypothetical protein